MPAADRMAPAVACKSPTGLKPNSRPNFGMVDADYYPLGGYACLAEAVAALHLAYPSSGVAFRRSQTERIHLTVRR